jgi:PPP family 3-phenylpropionic acid transporter
MRARHAACGQVREGVLPVRSCENRAGTIDERPTEAECSHRMVDTAESRRTGLQIRSLYLFIFLFLGGYGNFFPLWLGDLGWSDPAIGWLEALRYACLLVFPLVWGRLADRWRDSVKTLRWVTFGSALAFVPIVIFHDVIALTIALGVFFAFRVGLVPNTDSVTLSHVRQNGGEYGKIRVWGSAGFIVGGFLLGFLIDRFGRDVVPIPLAILLGITWLLTLRMSPEGRGPKTSERAQRSALELLNDPKLRPLYLITFLSRLASQGLFAFLPLHLQALGVSDAMMPLFWSVGVLSEIVLIRAAPRLFASWSNKSILSLCLAAAVLQYALTSLVESPWALLLVMLLHGLSFGVWYVTSVLHIGEHAEPGERSTAQGLFQMVGFGMGGILSSVAAGYLFESGQGRLLFGVATGLAVLTLVAHQRFFPKAINEPTAG